jgi:GrpB-like predicted nucleotidyltransferase (UPF0157 family)
LGAFPDRSDGARSAVGGGVASEAAALKTALPEAETLRVSHIGSTAVKNIWAKPTIDILVETPGSFEPISSALCGCGYLLMRADENRMDFNKGYTPEGFARDVFHLHLRHAGDNGECYFRDYLNEFPDVAKAYEALKLSLWRRFEHDRDAYTAAKTDFVTAYTRKARRRYSGRY